MAKHHEVGQRGEKIASEYLLAHGYDILEINWHCRYGEIDIIARDHDGLVVFCEVKSRRGSKLNTLIAITDRKRQRLIRSAQVYAHENDTDSWRIDAIAVVLHANGTYDLDHVEDALDW